MANRATFLAVSNQALSDGLTSEMAASRSGVPEGYVRPHDVLDDYGRWTKQLWGPRVAYALGVYFPPTAGVDVDEVTTVRRLALYAITPTGPDKVINSTGFRCNRPV